MPAIRAFLILILALAAQAAVAQRPAPEAEAARLALPQVGLRAQDIAVVVNDADPASVEVGRYYAARRGIAEGRVVHVRFPAGQAVMSAADFLRVQAVLDANVGAEVQAYALAWTWPYRVECMSVTAAFALGFDPPAYCAESCRTTKASPYFDSASRAPFTDHALRPAMLLAGSDVEGVKRLIDRGVRSDERWPGMLPCDASTSCNVITLRVFSMPAGDNRTASTSQAAAFCAALICSSRRPGLMLLPLPK